MRHLFAYIAVIAFLAADAAAADLLTVVQKGRAFSVSAIQIVHGGVARFVNDDRFLHQIYIDSPSLHFESDEQEPGTNVDIPVPVAGTFEVRCHIHPKMLLRIDAK